MRTENRVSRRDFMQLGAVAGATLALGGATGAQEPLTRPVRVGVVGVGNRGAYLTQTLLQFPDVVVAAVCDIVADRASRAQDIVEKACGARPDAYTNGDRDWERLVARDDLDAVICATSWEWHTPVYVAAMRSGKYAGTEVPAAVTLDECRELVRAHEESGVPCMMLENVCYFENALALLRMVREGVFGELLHAQAGYQHDCRALHFTASGELTWRGRFAAEMNGNLYPTHPIGPVAQWCNINRGDRFTRLVSLSTKSRGMRMQAGAQFGAGHPLAERSYALGDINTSLLETENGVTVTLYYDVNAPRPYDLIFRLQGTKGIHMGHCGGQIYLEGVSPAAHEYESFAPYLEKYAHPLWAQLKEAALESGGHGGADYITLYEFIKAVRARTQTPQDVYDAATWSAIFPLSGASAAAHGAPQEFPDFTGGKWKTNPPIPIRGA